jgi:hypothetical protein
LSSITREALIFLTQTKFLIFNGGRIQRGKIIRGLTNAFDQIPESDELIESARIIGHMLGKVNDAVTVFTSLGLTA